MKIDRGVQAILSSCLRNLKVCKVGIADDRDMKSAVEMGSSGMIYLQMSMTAAQVFK
jgi:hypothetical protein